MELDMARKEYKEDLRITKTKAALSNAFFDMLTNMTFEEITVNELCETAGVRRATFYKHFNDKNDFVTFIVKDVRDKFDQNTWNKDVNPTPTKEYYLKYAEAVMTFLVEREEAINKIIHSSIRSAFVDVFMQQNFLDTKSRLETSVEAGMKLISTPDVVTCMIIGGTSLCIIRWFEQENRCSADRLLADISEFIERTIG